jgi:hypothetical protein
MSSTIAPFLRDDILVRPPKRPSINLWRGRFPHIPYL